MLQESIKPGSVTGGIGGDNKSLNLSTSELKLRTWGLILSLYLIHTSMHLSG